MNTRKLTPEQALHRLAALCSRGERCSYDLRRKMQTWELSDSEQKQILRRLQQEGFQDDRRYCRAYVRDKSQYSRWGTMKISYELRKKQLPDEMIQEALSAISTTTQRDQLKQLIAQKRKSVKGQTEYEINQKLIRFAAGRGYALDDILRELHID